MNEQDDKTPHFTGTDERREQIMALFRESEKDEATPCANDEEVQQALEVLWRWLFEMRRDAVTYESFLKANCQSVNRLSNGVFDWRNSVPGAITTERKAQLQQFEYSMSDVTALYDEVTQWGTVAEYAECFSNARLSNSFAPPKTRDFYRPILKMLLQIGNGGKAKSVLQLIREKIASQTEDLDFLKLATPHITSQQWRAIGYRAARQMDKAGLLVSEGGEWAIMPKGGKFLEENE